MGLNLFHLKTTASPDATERKKKKIITVLFL